MKLGHVALDSTKVRANASKHKAMSYGRMKEKEEQLAAEVAELLRRAEEVDEEEDRRYGQDKRGDELPEELSFREGRLRKIREAKAALEAEAKAEAEQAESEGRNHPGVPGDKTQRNFTDPDSRIMPSPGGRDFQQSYNCQAVVDSAHQVIVAARATDQASDKGQAVAMVEEAIGNTGAIPREVSADAGYYSAKKVEELCRLGVDPYIAAEKTRHGTRPEPAPRGRIPKGLSARDRMRRKLRTKRGRERYALRMETVEPVFGQIKQGRGFRQFLLRGLEKVNREWAADLRRPQPAEALPARPQAPRQGTTQRQTQQQQVSQSYTQHVYAGPVSIHEPAPSRAGGLQLILGRAARNQVSSPVANYPSVSSFFSNNPLTSAPAGSYRVPAHPTVRLLYLETVHFNNFSCRTAAGFPHSSVWRRPDCPNCMVHDLRPLVEDFGRVLPAIRINIQEFFHEISERCRRL